MKVCPSCKRENVIIPVSYTVCLHCIQKEIDEETPGKKRTNRHEEDTIQEGLFNAVRMVLPKVGKLLFAVPNGGKRDKKEAKRLKKQGVIPGVSDIVCLIPNGKYSFLCLETKTPKGKQTAEQLQFQQEVTEAGGLYVLYYSVSEGLEILINYLNPTKYRKI